jgi:RNA-directed DNA polymerase
MAEIGPKPRQIASRRRLREIWKQSKDAQGRGSAPGIDEVTPRRFGGDIEHQIAELNRELISGEFRFSLLRPFELPKPNGTMRIICAPTVRDRLVQRLVSDYLTERDKLGVFNDVSYGFVRGRGGVLAAVQQARRLRPDFRWALKSDISSFFDTIDRQSLVQDLARKVGRTSIFPLLTQVVQCEVYEGKSRIRDFLRKAGIVCGKGLRQGMPLSPLLSNFVLRDFDRHFMGKHAKLVRYADDFVIFAKSEDECRELLADAKSLLAAKGHSVPEPGPCSKTVIAKPDEPVEFLGYDIVQRAGTGAYDIVIPKRAFEKVKITLARYEEFQAAMKEFKTLGRFMQSMNSIAQSYVAVYKTGKNIDDLRSHVENCRSASINRIAIDLFGSDVVGNLDDDKKAFLGLIIKPLDGEW